MAGESCPTGTCCGADQRTDGSALAGTGDGPDSSSSSCATAHHDCRALALSFTGHGGTGGLNLMVPSVDCDARERKAQRGATLETAGSFRLIHDSLSPRTLRHSALSFAFDG